MLLWSPVVLIVVAGGGCDRTGSDSGNANGDPPPAAIVPDQPAATLDADLSRIFQLIEEGRTGPARVRLLQYRRLRPDSGPAAFLFGLTYHREKLYATALSSYEEALALAPDYHPTYHFRGWAFYYLGELEASREAFETHIEYQPSEADSHFGLGLVALDEDRIADARTSLEHAWELTAEDAPAQDRSKVLTRLGDLEQADGNHEAARDAWRQAADIMPENGEAQYKLYRVLLRFGADDEAEAARRAYHEATGIDLESARPPESG